jgi:uncharacterized protein (DUF4415 family)
MSLLYQDKLKVVAAELKAATSARNSALTEAATDRVKREKAEASVREAAATVRAHCHHICTLKSLCAS